MEKEERSYHCGRKGPWVAHRIGRGIVIGIALVLVFSIFVRMLWNWLMPGIFGLRELTYGQTVGMIVLARILFGGRGLHGMRPRFGERLHGGRWAWSGPCGMDTANSGIEDWRHYDAWWEAEGREAFKKYSNDRRNERRQP